MDLFVWLPGKSRTDLKIIWTDVTEPHDKIKKNNSDMASRIFLRFFFLFVNVLECVSKRNIGIARNSYLLSAALIVSRLTSPLARVMKRRDCFPFGRTLSKGKKRGGGISPVRFRVPHLFFDTLLSTTSTTRRFSHVALCTSGRSLRHVNIYPAIFSF